MASHLLQIRIRACVCAEEINLKDSDGKSDPMKQFAIVDTHMEMCYTLLVSFSRLHEDLYNTLPSSFMKPDCYYLPTVTHSWTSFEIEHGECR